MSDVPHTLEASDMHVDEWWVDASFAVHPKMRSLTDGLMTLGSGGVYVLSKKQKLKTTSSTECELVGAHDLMPKEIFYKHNVMRTMLLLLDRTTKALYTVGAEWMSF